MRFRKEEYTMPHRSIKILGVVAFNDQSEIIIRHAPAGYYQIKEIEK